MRRPELQLSVDELQGLSEGFGKFYFFPQIFGGMGAFRGLYVEIKDAVVIEHCSVQRVGQRTGDAGAKTGEIMGIAAKRLWRVFYFMFEGAELRGGADRDPNGLVVLH